MANVRSPCHLVLCRMGSCHSLLEFLCTNLLTRKHISVGKVGASGQVATRNPAYYNGQFAEYRRLVPHNPLRGCRLGVVQKDLATWRLCILRGMMGTRLASNRPIFGRIDLHRSGRAKMLRVDEDGQSYSLVPFQADFGALRGFRSAEQRLDQRGCWSGRSGARSSVARNGVD